MTDPKDYYELSDAAVGLKNTAIQEELFWYYGIEWHADGSYQTSSATYASISVSENTGYWPEGEPVATPADIVRAVEKKYAHVADMFSDFSVLPDPRVFDAAIKSCKEAMYRVSADAFDDPIGGQDYAPDVNTALSPLLTSAEYLSEWNGLAAQAFIHNFAKPFENRMRNVFTAIAILRSAFIALRSIWGRMPTNLSNIATQGQTALKNCFECTSDDWSVAINVLSLLAAVPVPVIDIAEAVAKEGSAVAETVKRSQKVVKVVSSVDAVGTKAQALKDPGSEASENTYNASTPEEVIAKLYESIAHLRRYITQAEQDVADAMKTALWMITCKEYADDYASPRPDLMDADDDQTLIGEPDKDSKVDVTW